MSRLRVLLISSFTVFVICVLLAFFNGSSILWGLFKAFVSTCLAVVFMLVANFFLAKYIPDFFEGGAKVDEVDTTTIGSNLNIRINDENLSPIEQPDETPPNEESFSKSNLELSDGINENESVVDEPLSSPLQPLSLSSEDDGEETNLHTDNEQKADLEVSVPSHVDETNLSESEMSEAIEKDVDRLEELPDLQEFVDTSNLQTEQTRGEELMNTGTQSFFATDLSEDVSDTNLMAKAVRTVLKREV
ncbi:MAG: hypothetical protein ACTTJ3_06415 [Treponema sp.]